MRKDESMALWGNLVGSAATTGLGAWTAKKEQEEQRALMREYMKLQARKNDLQEEFYDMMKGQMEMGAPPPQLGGMPSGMQAVPPAGMMGRPPPRQPQPP